MIESISGHAVSTPLEERASRRKYDRPGLRPAGELLNRAVMHIDVVSNGRGKDLETKMALKAERPTSPSVVTAYCNKS